MQRKATTALILLIVGLLGGSLSSTTSASIPSAEQVLQTTAPPPAAADPAALAATPPSASDRVSFSLHFGEVATDYNVFATFVLPDEKLDITARSQTEGLLLTAQAEAGELTTNGPTSWRWKAPKSSGLYTLRFQRPQTGETLQLNAFVMVPYDGTRLLNGYTIGSYQAMPLRGNPNYLRPSGFVEVFPRLLDVPVSPHFKLGQFLCKQRSGYPKYLVLREPLLLKLEALLGKVRDKGIPADTFHVMSGFRTPYYNASIGNETIYSRHGYGDAADIMVDRNGDRRMDDLDGNGRSDVGDARFLLGLAEEVQVSDGQANLVGGLGLYGQRRSHGPFIHVDTRGFEVKW